MRRIRAVLLVCGSPAVGCSDSPSGPTCDAPAKPMVAAANLPETDEQLDRYADQCRALGLSDEERELDLSAPALRRLSRRKFSPTLGREPLRFLAPEQTRSPVRDVIRICSLAPALLYAPAVKLAACLCIALVALLGVACSDDEARTTSRCGDYAERAISLRIDGVDGDIATRHADNLASTRTAALERECQALSDSQIDCVLAAHDRAAARACQVPTLNAPSN